MAKALNDTLGVKRAIKHFDFSEPYWEGTKQKKLLIQYCKVAKKYQHFPRPVSIFTGRRRDIEWREASGKGTVFSYTFTHRGPPPFRGARSAFGGRKRSGFSACVVWFLPPVSRIDRFHWFATSA